jgi:hypothetical protein
MRSPIFDQAVENCDDLGACNHTELYQTCRRVGLLVHPSAGITILRALLEGKVENLTTEQPTVDKWRDGIMAYLIKHWKRVQSQLFCPAKSGDPRACYQCVDAQVTHCLITNPKVESSIEQPDAKETVK